MSHRDFLPVINTSPTYLQKSDKGQILLSCPVSPLIQFTVTFESYTDNYAVNKLCLKQVAQCVYFHDPVWKTDQNNFLLKELIAKHEDL